MFFLSNQNFSYSIGEEKCLSICGVVSKVESNIEAFNHIGKVC